MYESHDFKVEFDNYPAGLEVKSLVSFEPDSVDIEVFVDEDRGYFQSLEDFREMLAANRRFTLTMNDETVVVVYDGFGLSPLNFDIASSHSLCISARLLNVYIVKHVE